MFHAATARRWSRRGVLAGIAGAVAGPALVSSGAMAQANPVVNVTLPTPGSAGSIWRAAIASLDPSLSAGFDLHWIAGDPGQMQVQLAAGALDVGVFGAIGACDHRAQGQRHYLVRSRSQQPRQDHRQVRQPISQTGGPRRQADRQPSPKTTETYQQARVALSLVGVDMERDFETFFGPPTANLALFDRGDVDAVIVLEPTATRAVGAGARELARIGNIWNEASGVRAAPFLVGLAARARLDRFQPVARDVARAIVFGSQRCAAPKSGPVRRECRRDGPAAEGNGGD